MYRGLDSASPNNRQVRVVWHIAKRLWIVWIERRRKGRAEKVTMICLLRTKSHRRLVTWPKLLPHTQLFLCPIRTPIKTPNVEMSPVRASVHIPSDFASYATSGLSFGRQGGVLMHWKAMGLMLFLMAWYIPEEDIFKKKKIHALGSHSIYQAVVEKSIAIYSKAAYTP